MVYTSREKLAVALKYNPKTDFVPFVVAKGKEEVAEKIMELAKKSGVPIVRSSKIVGELFKLNVLEEIPEKMYVVIAEIIAFIQSQKGSE
ncbi:flagellar biosynthesis protein FlhB [Thermosipho melanesiensis]|uniref:Cytoplasmic domain of flagellar protein FhlB-like protein n=2 Tax=Thermosipho melanesiensis TaxID=46541 RepID=A6LN91_THEM4|nr:EscU/YscU/HrcU family type III secretion system export apparatus switch protein [Thermosipho melanesiensis]ABR31392.1 cytoplasmic domain of flagellar protein FhlB-like protein [Thermosipho melanesiensis BI429]APT74452.1 flagellar biosynthesis protein FlhB [Thermosipho melanesiensis]OOC36413.1 flagellar biosynthesis protein FlhB [Thermosipho melanesiensis]OOC37231.1 flagellar biosynthesis protein FlhB [Thermosipho melanesiensis]OOC37983.1 flagellar biosynthesis protein FlhB [Thermosipho mela